MGSIYQMHYNQPAFILTPLQVGIEINNSGTKILTYFKIIIPPLQVGIEINVH